WDIRDGDCTQIKNTYSTQPSTSIPSTESSAPTSTTTGTPGFTSVTILVFAVALLVKCSKREGKKD
ncbi:MAG: hypothetical protein ACFFAM_09085, partial [Promethearchaeota archaeon]